MYNYPLRGPIGEYKICTLWEPQLRHTITHEVPRMSMLGDCAAIWSVHCMYSSLYRNPFPPPLTQRRVSRGHRNPRLAGPSVNCPKTLSTFPCHDSSHSNKRKFVAIQRPRKVYLQHNRIDGFRK